MTFKLKNYTTGVAVNKSISETEQFLVAFGATHIMKEYLSDGTITSLSFKIDQKGFRIPANVEGVYNAVIKGVRTTKKEEQSARIAWRIIRDWVHAQLSIVMSGQAMPDEVMLPYLWDGKKTLYEAYSQGHIQIGYGDQE